MVKKTEIITDIEKNAVNLTYWNLSDIQLKIFQGKEVFLEPVHFDKYFVLQCTKMRPHREKFQSFEFLILLKFHFE